MNFLPVITCGLLGMGIVFLLIPLIIQAVKQVPFLQRARDLHHGNETPVPRFGGLALAVAFAIVELFITGFYPEQRHKIPGRFGMIAASLAMFALGFWDDLRPLGAKRKLLGQIAIALGVCFFGVGIEKFKIPFSGMVIDLGGWGTLITVAWLVGMTNLINLVDGVDGLAGGICLMLMALLAYVGHNNGSFELLTSGMVGALLAFLWFNFPPARIYMGDGGAYFLGFQLGLFSIASSHKGSIAAALVAPLIALALPILDVSLAILRRGLRGLPIFRPDRRHIHHRLIGMGLSRRKVVLSIYAVTLIFLVMGFIAFWSAGQLIPVLLGIGGLILLLCAGKLSFSREWFAVGRVLGNSLGMRAEVQYALCLTRWLEMEGKRRASVAGLWTDLIFVTQRLGFTSLKLTLSGETRAWQHPDVSGPVHCSRHELRGGSGGILELEALAHAPAADTESLKLAEPDEAAPPSLADSKLFEIMSELVAEGWLNATRRFENAEHSPLKFSSTLSAPRRKPARSHRSFAPALAPQSYAPVVEKP